MVTKWKQNGNDRKCNGMEREMECKQNGNGIGMEWKWS